MKTYRSNSSMGVYISAIVVVMAMLVAACGGSSSSQKSSNTTVAGAGSDTTVEGAGPVEIGDRLPELRIYHPETLAFAAPFTIMQTEGTLSNISDKVSIDTWTTPDTLRSLVTSNQADMVAVPTYVGANLYNKGMDVRMAAVLVWGLLYLVGPDGTPADWDSLRGQTVMVPFQNDMPDLVFKFLAEKNGLEPGKDFQIEYYATPIEAVQRLIAGQGKWAVLPEHVVTVALKSAQDKGQSLGRVMNLQDEWATATGLEPRIPQAGVIVTGDIASRTDVLAALLDGLDAAVAQVNVADEETVAKLSEAFGLGPELVASLIPRLNLDVVPGADARGELERFCSELAEYNPDIIGGKLPDDGFYLADPR